MDKKPVISIIMASYNHAEFIGQAIKSIRHQDYDAWELLIADDASTDNTLEVLDAYKNDPRIKIFPFEINRQYHMRNFAAGKACGDYFAFLNSDDLFYPGKLKKQVQLLEKNPHYAAVFTHVHCIDDKNTRLKGHKLEQVFASDNHSREEWLRHFFFSGNRLCLSSAMIRRDTFESVGAFNPLLIQIGDLDLWIKICLNSPIHVIDEPLTAARILKDNLSNPNPATLSRLTLEQQQVYAHYFSPEAIEQAIDIFPEFIDILPEDTPEWRYYCICRTAAGMHQKSMRLLGFSKIQDLLNDEKTKSVLLHKNPRLLRTLFFSEGTAGLDTDAPRIEWVLFLHTPDDPEGCKRLFSYHTSVLGNSPICFSFPKPKGSVGLRLTLSGRFIPFKCQAFRLYDQQTGSLIFDSNTEPQSQISSKSSFYDFPTIDFSAFAAKWIDIEIDRKPIPINPLWSKLKKKWSRLFRKY